MSDLSIPGVTDKYNTQKVIDALMAVAREPLTRKQKELDTSTQKKTAWQDMNRQLSGLRDTARTLFGFQNPFNDRIATSSDASVLTATATRQAIEETKDITVKKIATADRFLSRPLPRDFAVEAGQYTFKVGDKQVSLAWKGGTLKAFADALNAKGTGVISASVVNDTTSTQVLLVEGKITGSTNRLTFADKAVDLGVNTGMMTRSSTASRTITLDAKAVAAWTAPLAADGYTVQAGALTVNPGAELRIPLNPSAALNSNMVLQMSVKVERLPETAYAAPPAPPGPSVPPTGGVDYKGVHIDNSNSQAPLPPYTPPTPPANITDLQSLFIESGGKTQALQDVPDVTDWQTIQVPVGQLAATLDAIDIRNRNTYRRIDIKDITVFDKTQRGDYVPANALSEAGDAQIAMDGIDVKRSSNTIDDLLPGVTLTLKAPSTGPVELSIKHDIAEITKQVETLVGTYNQILTNIDIYTRKDDTVIADATWLTDAEKTKAQANLGLFQGDLSLQQLKSTLQQTMMNPYPTSRGRDLVLLAQAGISTDTRAPGSASIDKTRLRGYLEVDEAKLAAAVESNAEAVKQLFGNDTTGDLVVDSGAAYTLDTILRPYVQTGGLVTQRIDTLTTQIKDENKAITDLQAKLTQKEAELKAKYAQMSGALDQLAQNETAISNFTKQNSTSGQ